MKTSIFNYLKNVHTVFHSGCTNLHSCREYTSLLFSVSSLTLVIPFLFNAEHSNRPEMISHCSFWFTFPFWLVDVEYIFMYLLAIWIYLLCKNVYSGLLLIFFLFWVLIFSIEFWEFVIFGVLTPYQINDLQMFFHNEGCLFIFFNIFFCILFFCIERSFLVCSCTCLFFILLLVV